MLSIATLAVTSVLFTITDGDTIKLDGQRFRLAETDAPESRQLCTDEDGQLYAAGADATAHLAFLMEGKQVTCTWQKEDIYGRPIASCTVEGDGMTLSEHMVRDGWAYAAYGADYFTDELVARAARRGIWQGDCEAPAQWRREHHHRSGRSQ